MPIAELTEPYIFKFPASNSGRKVKTDGKGKEAAREKNHNLWSSHLYLETIVSRQVIWRLTHARSVRHATSNTQPPPIRWAPLLIISGSQNHPQQRNSPAGREMESGEPEGSSWGRYHCIKGLSHLSF